MPPPRPWGGDEGLWVGATGEAASPLQGQPWAGHGAQPTPESSRRGLGNSCRWFCSSSWFVSAARWDSPAPRAPLRTHRRREHSPRHVWPTFTLPRGCVLPSTDYHPPGASWISCGPVYLLTPFLDSRLHAWGWDSASW